MNRDISHLHEEFTEYISQSERAMTRMIAELEVRFEKLELEVEKMAAGGVVAANSRMSAQKVALKESRL